MIPKVYAHIHQRHHFVNCSESTKSLIRTIDGMRSAIDEFLTVINSTPSL